MSNDNYTLKEGVHLPQVAITDVYGDNPEVTVRIQRDGPHSWVVVHVNGTGLAWPIRRSMGERA
jgi:hypothetical protein